MSMKIPEGLSLDAIELKIRCREDVRQDTAGLSNAERRRRLEEWLAASGDSLAVFWRQMEHPREAPAPHD